jgi:mono/diheme cytochrome c family protein
MRRGKPPIVQTMPDFGESQFKMVRPDWYENPDRFTRKAMSATIRRWQRSVTIAVICTAACLAVTFSSAVAGDCGGSLLGGWHWGRCNGRCAEGAPPEEELGGTWYWLRSPEEERRVVMGLFNKYCIRCHGVDGRGVWDIPGIPDFTNTTWQASRSDGQIARIVMEGRGAVMPPFRGALNLEEAWGIARYLRTLVPGAEASKPETGKPGGPR